MAAPRARWGLTILSPLPFSQEAGRGLMVPVGECSSFKLQFLSQADTWCPSCCEPGTDASCFSFIKKISLAAKQAFTAATPACFGELEATLPFSV